MRSTRPTRLQRIQLAFQRCVKLHHPLSRMVGVLAHCRWPWVKNSFIWVFLRLYKKINRQEAEQSNPYAYKSFNAFFTRQLKAGSRPITALATAIASPADGIVSDRGKIKEGSLLHAKSAALGLSDLLGGDKRLTQYFHHGSFVTIYLAPKDYHRVHMPYTGTLKTMIHVPGKLFSVSPLTVKHIPNLFTRNERIILHFETDCGPMAVVMVGAMIVASIATQWAGVITPPLSQEVRRWDYTDKAITFERGAELGHFELGSTVLVLFPDDKVAWHQAISPGVAVKMGQMLGRLS